MGFLDRLKPQPRWKHADPAIRLEALRELDDATELAMLAENDPDARVRRASVARISDVAVLTQVATHDAEPETRERAADRLMAIASAADADEPTCLAAVRGLTDTRRLSTLAKSDASDAVRGEALARVEDCRALGSIARHAKHEATAAAALARLADAKELLETALNSEHKDVALTAFERAMAPAVGDLTLLRLIESRAQQKAVTKRARALIQEIEAAEAARIAAEEERRRRQATLVDAVERTAGIAGIEEAEAELARLVAAWAELPNVDETEAERFEQGRINALLAIADRRREADEAAERARLRAEALATRNALCVRVETLEGDDMPEQLVPIEEEWRSLMPLVAEGPEADRLAERFAKAVAACRKRHELGAVLAEIRLRLEALVVEAEGLLSPSHEGDAAAAEARWHELSREARGLAATLSDGMRPAPELGERLEAVAAAFAAREAAAREAQRQTQEERLTRLRQLGDRARRAVGAEALTLREGERLMRDLKAGLDEAETGRADAAREDPAVGRDLQDACAELRRLQEQIAPRVRELREMDEWRRFANAQQQEKLIAMAEAIVTSLKSDMETGKESDLLATARALKELNAKWQEAAEAPRHSAQKLWERFRIATEFIRGRCEGFFARLREERGANLQKKMTLVEEAEKLASSTDWAQAAARIQELQAEWETTGPVARDAARELAHRFRTACNQFFSRRREDLTTRKKIWADNLAAKEALCQRAEALVESTDWEAASAEMKQLQAEWKTIGPVRRNKSEAIWQRFRGAADRFFDRYHNRHQITLMNKLAEREALVVDLEAFARHEEPEAPADLGARVQELRAGWNRGVPVPAAEMRPLAERWQAALARVVERWPDAFEKTELDPTAVRERMAKLVARVESLAIESRETQGLSQTELLAARLRSALASNAMGGRATHESRLRTAMDTVKDAQAAWLRLPPAPGSEARILEARFREACRRVMDQARRQTADSRRNKPSMERPTAAVV